MATARRATKSTMIAPARRATTPTTTTTMATTMTMATAVTRWAVARRYMKMTTMATGDDDNDVDGDGATGNVVDDDSDGATGDDNDD